VDFSEITKDQIKLLSKQHKNLANSSRGLEDYKTMRLEQKSFKDFGIVASSHG